MQENNLMPQKDIAQKVNLSTTAVHRRIKRLQQTGVIEKNVAVLNPEKVGNFITLILNVSLNDVHFRATDEAKKLFLSIPQVQQCFHVTGDAEFILVITLSSMSDYPALNRRLFENNPNIKGLRTYVSIDSVKTGHHLEI